MSESVSMDVFNETMKRIEAMMSASEARHSAIMHQQAEQIEQIRGEVKELRAVVEGYGDTLAVTVEALNSRASRWGIVIGAVLSFAAVVIAAVSVYVGVFR